MTINNQELLEKVDTTTPDLINAGLLSPQQAEQFLRLAIESTKIGPDASVIIMGAPKWQQPKIVFGSRILRPGSELTRIVEGDRAKPTLSQFEMSTVLVRGEVPVSDEVFEDNIERAGFADTLVALIADRAGLDLEELFVNGDTSLDGGDPYLDLLDGWIVQADDAVHGHVVDGGDYGADYQSLFQALINALPVKYFRNPAEFKLYCSIGVEYAYRESIAARGTPLGDQFLMGRLPLAYQGVPVVGVPVFPNTGDSRIVLLTHPKNLYIGFQRRVRLETFRDPREGGTSFVVSARADAKVGHVDATAIATSVA
jgi:HK97 family phage major capsid protein